MLSHAVGPHCILQCSASVSLRVDFVQNDISYPGAIKRCWLRKLALIYYTQSGLRGLPSNPFRTLRTWKRLCAQNLGLKPHHSYHGSMRRRTIFLSSSNFMVFFAPNNTCTSEGAASHEKSPLVYTKTKVQVVCNKIDP